MLLARSVDVGLSSPSTRVDLLMFAVGYEARSVHVARAFESLTSRLLGIGFGTRQLLNFTSNRSTLDDLGGAFVDVRSGEFTLWATKYFASLDDSMSRIAIDISSFSRDRIGVLLRQGHGWLLGSPQRVLTILYALPRFSPNALEDANNAVGSAELLEGYEGYWTDPDLPLTAIVGLGFEASRALGSVELVEAAEVIAYIPTSNDARFERNVRRLNGPLLASHGRVVSSAYSVMDPGALFDEISRAVVGIERTGRAVFIPMGPKIFASVALLVAIDSGDRVPVWRVSTGDSGPSFDCVAAGPICGIELSENGEPRAKKVSWQVSNGGS